MRLSQKQEGFLEGCSKLAVSVIRQRFKHHPGLISRPAITAIRQMLLKGRLKPSIQQGASRVLVALLPDSFDVIEEMLSLNTPRGVHDVHFTVFASLEQSDFNYTEQAGIEYLLVNYLMKARSSACYSAWKAGLTLADAWHSTRSEARLVELLFSAHYSAGRLGALNGCEHILKHRQTLTPQDLAPLLSVARNDPSERVRKTAQFILEYRLGVKPRAKRENR